MGGGGGGGLWSAESLWACNNVSNKLINDRFLVLCTRVQL